MGLWREGELAHIWQGAAPDPHVGPICGGSFADVGEKQVIRFFLDGFLPKQAKVTFILGFPGSCSPHCPAALNQRSIGWITRVLDVSALLVDFEGT